MSARLRCLVVAGVSGSGKSTLGRELARVLRWEFVEGDDLHPRSNIEKMRSGLPLTDQDRGPWLRAVRRRIEDTDGDLVVACSALRRSYRDVLREGEPGLAFCLVQAPRDVVAARLRARTDHYMPASLLDSQLATLEPLEPDEPGLVVDSTLSPEDVVHEVITRLGLSRAEC